MCWRGWGRREYRGVEQRSELPRVAVLRASHDHGIGISHQEAARPGGVGELSDVGCALATEPGRRGDAVAESPKRLGEAFRDVLAEQEVFQRLLPLAFEVLAVEEEEGVDVLGVGLVVGDGGADRLLGEGVVAGGRGDIPAVALEVGDRGPDGAAVVDEAGAVAAGSVGVEGNGEVGRLRLAGWLWLGLGGCYGVASLPLA